MIVLCWQYIIIIEEGECYEKVCQTWNSVRARNRNDA